VSQRRIVVTGMGLICPVGNTVNSSWEAICQGRSGIGPFTEFDASPLTTRIAGEIRDLDLSLYLDDKEARRCDKFIHYGIAASVQAVEEAGLTDVAAGIDPERIGFAVGAGIGGIGAIENNMLIYRDKGPRRISPFYIPGAIINATATHNIGVAARMIRYGDADVMVAGGAEYATTPTAMAGFIAAKAMSARNDDPEAASRPWDRERDGFVLANGAGVLVLEELEHARRRGAHIHAEVVGFGMSGDAYHVTAPPDDGEGAARCMEIALADAHINPEQVDYINAHGTSTPLGDRAESDAVKTVMGEHAYRLVMSSTKSMTGHMLGAAGGAEAVFTILAMRDNVAPPTINLDNPGEGCDLDYAANQAREMPINIALSNSFGFGGTNGTLVFRQFQG